MPPRLWLRSLFWRKTPDDLLAELTAGKRRMIHRDEIELARAYQRRIMPAGIRYPREGEVYEAIEDVTISYMTSHYAPFTGGGKAVLPKGERVRVSKPIENQPVGVYCDPLRYDRLHDLIVPAEERANECYSGYYLSIDTPTLNKSFRLVAGVPAVGEHTDANDRAGG